MGWRICVVAPLKLVFLIRAFASPIALTAAMLVFALAKHHALDGVRWMVERLSAT